MKSILFWLYGLSAYLLFLFTMAWLMGFLGNILVSRSVDSPAATAFFTAFCIDLLLLLQFGLQHSLMARQWFKRWWLKWVPRQLERSTYVLFSSLSLLLLMGAWQPLGGVVWQVDAEWAQTVLYALFFSGWTIMITATFLINHWDLFGLRQIYLFTVGRPYTAIDLAKPFFYQRVRHPLYLGFLILFWATPNMTLSHLVLAIGISLYIGIGLRLEERNLIADFGDRYRHYRERVPMILPWKIGLPRIRD